MNYKKSLSEKVKHLRQQKAWSQSHLAEAAGLSTRTVQRLEQTGSCSDETLLCIASALDVDIQEFTSVKSEQQSSSNSLLQLRVKNFIPGNFLWIGMLLMAPAVIFISSNILKYELNIPQVYDFFVWIAEVTGLIQYSDLLIHPIWLLGGLIIASVLGVSSLLEINGSKTENGFLINGVHFSFNRESKIILTISLVSLTILVGYAAIENIADWISSGII